jgi:hypothetical protein
VHYVGLFNETEACISCSSSSVLWVIFFGKKIFADVAVQYLLQTSRISSAGEAALAVSTLPCTWDSRVANHAV